MTQTEDKTEEVKTLYAIIMEDIDTSFRAGLKHRTSVLKTLVGDAVKEARRKEVRLPTDAEMIGLMRKFVANAEINAVSFDKMERGEKAAESRAEIAILKEYLPAEISADDVRAYLLELKANGTIPAGKAGMGTAVKALREKYGDAFDGKTMTPIAQEVVSA